MPEQKTKVAVPGKTPGKAEGPRDPGTKPELEPRQDPGQRGTARAALAGLRIRPAWWTLGPWS